MRISPTFAAVAALLSSTWTASAQLETDFDWSASGGVVGAQFGRSVAGAGDVDADGFCDVICGAPHYASTQLEGNEGQARVYLGSPAGLSTQPVWSVESDKPGARLGWSVAGAGDVNGDGFADVVVGAPFWDATSIDEGRAVVYAGGASGVSAAPVWSGAGEVPGARFGEACAGAGDVNGDGFADIAVGAPEHTSNPIHPKEGRAYVFLGSAAGPSNTPTWVQDGEGFEAYFGAALVGFDADSDGLSDLAVGAPGTKTTQWDAGRVYLYLGTPGGLSTTAAAAPESKQQGAQFGAAIDAGSDATADGFVDLIVGMPFTESLQPAVGRAVLYDGAASGLSVPLASWLVEGSQTDSWFGMAVGSPGDLDQDGFGDLAVGAPAMDQGQTNEGVLFVYRGDAQGPATTPSWTKESDQVSALLGMSVRGAGDVDGDGFLDLIAGASGMSAGLGLEGIAFQWGGTCGEPAQAVSYGAGKPGSAGVPSLTSSAPPVLGQTTDLTIAGGPPGAPALLLVGLAPAAIPFDGGTLVVAPIALLPAALDASGALTLQIALPKAPPFCGAAVYFQGLIVDPAAQGFYHTAQTPGLLWIAGA